MNPAGRATGGWAGRRIQFRRNSGKHVARSGNTLDAILTSSEFMSEFRVLSIAPSIAEAARQTRRSPEFGHRVEEETASGTGPCRVCLKPFTVGADRRMLFTYRPEGTGALPFAPGPIYIHSERCSPWEGAGFPDELISFPLIVEGWSSVGELVETAATTGSEAGTVLDRLLGDPTVAFAHIRHGEAGCHIARAERRTTGSL